MAVQSCNPWIPSGDEGIVIDMTKTYQTIEGFGSCITNYKDFPKEYSDSLFFDRVVNDLGLSIVRVPLMEHTEWINDDDDPDHFNWDGFWLKNNLNRKGIEESMWLMQQFKERGVERFMGTPWSPPEFMKTTRSPIQGGYLRADMLAEYAEYMAAQIILAKKNYGIDLNWVSIQNELLFIEFYRSCIYNPWMLKEAVRALMTKFEKEGIRTKILMPEDMMFVDRMLCYINPTMSDSVTKNFNGHFCTHRRGGKEDLQTWLNETKEYKRQTWMTETSGHQQSWEGALKMASDIHEYLVYGNISAWIYWQLSDEGDGVFSILVDGKPTPKYYAAKHFYRYIRPGAVRLEAISKDNELQVSAFHHPVDGTLTLVLINNSESDISTTTNLDHSFEVYRSTRNEECIPAGKYAPGEKIFVPAKGILTLVQEHRSLKTEKRLPELPESWDIPADITEDQWGNAADFPRKTSFQLKADNGNISIISQLKEQNTQEIFSHRRHNGWTWLHAALMNGDGDAVKFLVEQGADVNVKANDGWTPLHMAAASFVDNSHKEGRLKDYSRYDQLKILLDAGADLSAVTDDGWTALHAACANAYNGWRGVPEHCLGRIDLLIDAGIDIEAKDIHGRTALHWAAMQGYFFFTDKPEVHADVVNRLIEACVNVDGRDDEGRTALHYAVLMGYSEIVLALVKAGASTNLKDQTNQSALQMAEKSGDKTLRYILEFGCFPDQYKSGKSDPSTMTSDEKYKYGPELLKSAWEGDLEKVKELLEKGADIGYIDSDGFSAIQRAKDNGYEEIVNLIKSASESEE